MKTLKNRYNSIIEEYVALFCEKQGMNFEFWVADQVGTIGLFGDYYFNFEDIKLDIDENISKGVIFSWYNVEVDDYNKNGKHHVNYWSYIKGYREKNLNK